MIPGCYEEYKHFWSEYVLCYTDDNARDERSNAALEFVDFCNLASMFSKIEGGKLLAPMWVVDDLLSYLSPNESYALWSMYAERLMRSVYIPISLCSFHEVGNQMSVYVYFADTTFAAPVQDYPHMSTYDYYLCLDTGLITNPFESLGARKLSQLNGVFDLDDFLENQYQWVQTGNGHACKPTDLRMYLHTLSKRIKTKYHHIQIKGSTLSKCIAMTGHDTDVFAPISHEMQKALIVKMIVTNPYISCNLVIV